MSVDGKIYNRLMEFCLLLHYLKPIVRKLYRRICVALRGIIALLYAEPLVHLPLPSVPINTRLEHNTRSKDQFSSDHSDHQSHTSRNSLALKLIPCSSFRLDRPAALGRHTLDLVVAALLVKAFGYADIVTSTAIRGKANALPFGACRSG